jgi:hypothetical protein
VALGVTRVSGKTESEGIEWPRARTGSSGVLDEDCRVGLSCSNGCPPWTTLLEEGPGEPAARIKAQGEEELSLLVLNALIAGSALRGSWINEGDHEQGSVGLRCSCGLLLVPRNLAGISGTSGSEARLIVDSGDFRTIVEEVERLAEESVDPDRLRGIGLHKRLRAEGEGVAVDEGLTARCEGEYGEGEKNVDGLLFAWKAPGDGDLLVPDADRRLGGYIAD